MAKKNRPTDGLGPHEIAKIRSAIRQVWQRSMARRLTLKRATRDDGYQVCEQCKKQAPKVYIDHIVQVGELDGGFIERLFCSSDGLQALCKKCHDEKTKQERKIKKIIKDLVGEFLDEREAV